MRATTLAKRLLAVTSLLTAAVEYTETMVLVHVRPRWRKPRCGECGRRGPQYDQQESRQWRSLPWGGMAVGLVYAPRRVNCPRCGVRTESVPWARHRARFTKDFEEMVAYMVQLTDRTTVTQMLGISWRSVGRIIDRIVNERLDTDRLAGLRHIGIDEFSYRKRHRYITVVVNHETHRVVWVGEGKGSDTLEKFFQALGQEGRQAITHVTMDMAGGYIKAVTEQVPQAQIVFDRFHVQKLAGDALDEVRRELWREQQGKPEGRFIKKSRFALLKNPWNLTVPQRRRLRDIQRTNKPLYRAYLLKESLAKALDYLQPKRACDALNDWLAWASRSKLKPFVRLARTIRKYKDGILAYIGHRLTNGVVEGINNHTRVIARRAYGFHSPKALISMLFLCSGGIEVKPRLP